MRRRWTWCSSTSAAGASVDLASVRAHIDRIDEAIVAMLAERQRWVVTAGNLKTDAAAVSAPDRVEAVIARAKALATETGASPDVIEATYRAMIAAFIALELAVHSSTTN